MSKSGQLSSKALPCICPKNGAAAQSCLGVLQARGADFVLIAQMSSYLANPKAQEIPASKRRGLSLRLSQVANQSFPKGGEGRLRST